MLKGYAKIGHANIQQLSGGRTSIISPFLWHYHPNDLIEICRRLKQVETTKQLPKDGIKVAQPPSPWQDRFLVGHAIRTLPGVVGGMASDHDLG